jgi:hypothetical protein
MAAGLSIYPRFAGTASGLMGFTQMIVASLGTFLVALWPYDSAFGTIIVVGGFIAFGLGFGIFAVRQPGGSAPPVLGGIVPPQPARRRPREARPYRLEQGGMGDDRRHP